MPGKGIIFIDKIRQIVYLCAQTKTAIHENEHHPVSICKRFGKRFTNQLPTKREEGYGKRRPV
jgi:hypothetical protein